MRAEEIDALLGGEAQRLADQYRSVPVDFMDGYGWAITQVCRMFADAENVIRCKDCKYSSPNRVYGCRIKSFADDMDKRMYADDWCSFAERKED